MLSLFVNFTSVQYRKLSEFSINRAYIDEFQARPCPYSWSYLLSKFDKINISQQRSMSKTQTIAQIVGIYLRKIVLILYSKNWTKILIYRTKTIF